MECGGKIGDLSVSCLTVLSRRGLVGSAVRLQTSEVVSVNHAPQEASVGNGIDEGSEYKVGLFLFGGLVVVASIHFRTSSKYDTFTRATHLLESTLSCKTITKKKKKKRIITT